MIDVNYTEAELSQMTASELAELCVIARPVAKTLPPGNPFQMAKKHGMIQSIPFHGQRIVTEARRIAGPGGDVLRAAMKLTRGFVNPSGIQKWMEQYP